MARSITCIPDSRSLKSDGQDWVIRRTLLFNLLDGDDRANRTNLEPDESRGDESRAQNHLRSQDAAGPPSRLVRYLPAIMAFLFYIFLLTASNILLRNISSEKENRTIEVLLLSVTPRQLLVGKLVGLGIASLAAYDRMGRCFLCDHADQRIHIRSIGSCQNPDFRSGVVLHVFCARLCRLR